MSIIGLVPILENAQCYLSTSTNHNANHGVFGCRLNFKNDPNKEIGIGENKESTFDGSEGWCASILDTNQWVMAGCEIPRTFVAVAIQGRGDYLADNQWVTSYKVRYSLDNITWVEYNNGVAIQGAQDRDTPVTYFFDTPIRARSIAICPLTWNGHIALRFELYAKPSYYTFTQAGHIDSGVSPILNGPISNNNATFREQPITIVFPVEFSKVPTINLTFDHIDCTSSMVEYDLGQVRIQVEARNITTKGFDAVFATWGTSKAYRLKADWNATTIE